MSLFGSRFSDEEISEWKQEMKVNECVNISCSALTESHKFQLEMFSRKVPWVNSGYVLSPLTYIEVSEVQGKGLVMSLPSKHYKTYTPKEYLTVTSNFLVDTIMADIEYMAEHGTCQIMV